MGIVFSEGNREARFYWWQLQVSQSEGSSHLLQAGACACLWSSLGNNSWVRTRWCARTRVCICTLVCECLCMCVDVFMRTQSYRGLSPTRLPLLFLSCFVFLLSLQETNTGSLCPLLDLPSVPGDQVGGQMLCRNARPSSGSWASVSSHCWTEVACGFVLFCFIFFALVTNKDLVLSPLFFLPFVFLCGTTWDGNRDLVAWYSTLSALVRETVSLTPYVTNCLKCVFTNLNEDPG